MTTTLRQEGAHLFLDVGPRRGPAVVLLHGMMGGVDNWTPIFGPLIDSGFRVLVPQLPIYALPLSETNVRGLVEHVVSFMAAMEVPQAVLGGNSLGGQIALLVAADHPERTQALVLTGSSGLYELDVGTSVMRRRDRAFIRERAALTFHDSSHVTDALMDEVFAVVNDRASALRLIRMARSIQAESVRHRLADVQCPALLIWGEDDRLTPPFVADEFQSALRHATLHLLPECGHAPQMEQPEAFAALLLDFLRRVHPVVAGAHR